MAVWLGNGLTLSFANAEVNNLFAIEKSSVVILSLNILMFHHVVEGPGCMFCCSY